MVTGSENNVEVVCIDEIEDAQSIYERIQQFMQEYFEGRDDICR